MNNNQNIHQEDEIDLRELWDILYKKKWFIFIFTTIVTIGAIVFAYTKTPIYEVKSNIKVGFIGTELITEPSILAKTLSLIFNVEDKIATKEKFVSEVSSITVNKKLKNFIEIKTQAISNDEALKKNREVVAYLKDLHKGKFNQYAINGKNDIKMIQADIKNLEQLEAKNLKRQIELLKSQTIVKIDEKIKRLQNQDIKNIERQIELLKSQVIPKIDKKINFYKNTKTKTLEKKVKFHTEKLKEYAIAVDTIYKNNQKNSDVATLTISSLQMVNYQNLILNSQNKVEDLKLEIDTIINQTVPNLEIEKNNTLNVAIKDLQLKIDNIKDVTIVNLQRDKKIMQNDTLRKLEYKLSVGLSNKKIKLNEQINQLRFNMSDQNIQNSEVVGDYVVKESPIKPKKKLIVVVAFVTGFILSIFIVFFLNFIAKETEDKHNYT